MIEFRKLLHPSYFYPRSPCGERPRPGGASQTPTPISIHALLAESDCFGRIMSVSSGYFYPRSPCGERLIEFRKLLHPSYFYPRSPCGERLNCSRKGFAILLFLSTLSLRRATVCSSFVGTSSKVFLSTLSLRRATRGKSSKKKGRANFYPRSPCGERRQQPDGTTKTTYFYPRSPCGERHVS